MLRIFSSKREEVREQDGDDYITRSFKICNRHQILLGGLRSRRMRRKGYSTVGGDKKCTQNFSRITPTEDIPLGMLE